MRPRKGDECEIPHAARAASGDDDAPPRLRAQPPLHVTKRLFQLMFLVLLFSFGLLGSLLFTVRPPTMSHAVLRHGIARLHDRFAGIETSKLHPLYFSVAAMDHESGIQSEAVSSFTQRFVPDLLVIQGKQSTDVADAIGRALPHHRRLNMSSFQVAYNSRLWQHAEDGVIPGTTSASWLRLRFNSAATNSSVIVIPCPTITDAAQVADSLRLLAVDSSSMLFVGDVSAQQTIAPLLALRDPFTYLQVAGPLSSATNQLFASPHLRPVAASTVTSSGLPTPVVTAVYELLASN